MHFGMTGSLAYFKSPEEEPSHSRLLFAFENEDNPCVQRPFAVARSN